jgi:hypothetical protein
MTTGPERGQGGNDMADPIQMKAGRGTIFKIVQTVGILPQPDARAVAAQFLKFHNLERSKKATPEEQNAARAELVNTLALVPADVKNCLMDCAEKEVPRLKLLSTLEKLGVRLAAAVSVGALAWATLARQLLQPIGLQNNFKPSWDLVMGVAVGAAVFFLSDSFKGFFKGHLQADRFGEVVQEIIKTGK